MKASEALWKIESWDREGPQQKNDLPPSRVLHREVTKPALRQETFFVSWNWEWIQALGQERDQLRHENDQLRRENKELRAQVGQLSSSRQVSGTLPKQLVSTNPYSSWIERNREVLAQYPDSFLAVDVKAGKIVEHSKDQSELNRKLVELFKRDEGARTRLFIIDTALES